MHKCSKCNTEFEGKFCPECGTASGENAQAGNDLDNLYTLARRALQAQDYAKAEMYYTQILLTKPNDWEAAFYSVYAGATALAGRSLSSAIQNLRRGHVPAYDLIASAFTDADTQSEKLAEIVDALCRFTVVYYDYAKRIYRELGGFDNRNIFANQAGNMEGMMLDCGDAVHAKFTGAAFDAIAAKAWKRGVEILDAVCAEMPGLADDGIKKMRSDAVEKIRNVDPSYTDPAPANKAKTGGCYIATCVYGSYDCAEVWTLRRYRDDTLAATRRGRAFIRLYYAISPTVVKLFGNKEWFRKMWKKKLDKKVAKLQAKGVQCTPYEDKDW